MKCAGQWLLGLCFVLLFCLCAATLVEGPETALPPPPPSPPPVHAGWTEISTPEVNHAPLRLNGAAARRSTFHECAKPSIAAVMPVRESNGFPLAGESWVRSVYAACPPEGEVG